MKKGKWVFLCLASYIWKVWDLLTNLSEHKFQIPKMWLYWSRCNWKRVYKKCEEYLWLFSRKDGKDSYKGLFLSYFKMKYKTVDYIETDEKRYGECWNLPFCSLQSTCYGIDYSFRSATVYYFHAESLWGDCYGNQRQTHCRGGVYPFN